MSESLEVGTLVQRRTVRTRFLRHFGIVMGQDLVVHIDMDWTGRVRVKENLLAAFAAGHRVFAEAPQSSVSLDEMRSRLAHVIAERPRFSLLNIGSGRNCESIARFVQSGAYRSRQAAAAKAVFATGVIVSAGVEVTVVYLGALAVVTAGSRVRKALNDGMRQAAGRVAKLRNDARDASWRMLAFAGLAPQRLATGRPPASADSPGEIRSPPPPDATVRRAADSTGCGEEAPAVGVSGPRRT